MWKELHGEEGVNTRQFILGRWVEAVGMCLRGSDNLATPGPDRFGKAAYLYQSVSVLGIQNWKRIHKRTRATCFGSTTLYLLLKSVPPVHIIRARATRASQLLSLYFQGKLQTIMWLEINQISRQFASGLRYGLISSETETVPLFVVGNS